MILVASSIVLLATIDITLANVPFAIGMFTAGAALGLLGSQLGNVNMSSVGEEKSSEVGGPQGVFQNLGSSLGTALIGSVLMSTLAVTFSAGVAASELPGDVQQTVATTTQNGVQIIPSWSVVTIATDAGLTESQADTLAGIYSDAQIQSLRVAFFALVVLALGTLVFSPGIPGDVLGRAPRPDRGPRATRATRRSAPARRTLIP